MTERQLLYSAIVALLVVAATACSKADRREPPPPAPLPPTLASSSQNDLAKEVDVAMQNNTWLELQHRWTGQHLRWTVTRHALLCRDSDKCFVAAFPVQGAAKQGWLPGLTFAHDEYAKLTAACGNADCEFTFEGVVDEVRGSEAEPAAIHFKDVHFVARTPDSKVAKI